ncbi:uncharacterized protein LOC109818549 [Cajanus cajan]|uniref:Uncharacterized protein n=1 Tax=Cajanus cajan TaxID=3821 RepID=A0A151RI63_CAJCA|nr:uncharacterized protein LOC109818549 [Cajanus cajan]KYP42201.1 hypothetical protein KK1_036385 [Cajanus cajan]
MERRKPKKDDNNNNNKTTNDDSAFVKAAAWAWYQHNSGSNSKGKTITEFEATITRRAARPSRYKLEAMRNMGNEENEGDTKKVSLLDEYEVQSISRLVESCSSNHNKVVTDNSTNGRVKKKKVGRGFWVRHGAVCGREEDVVDPGAKVKRLPLQNATRM